MKNKKYLFLGILLLAWGIVATVQLYNKAINYQNKCNYKYSFGGNFDIWNKK